MKLKMMNGAYYLFANGQKARVFISAGPWIEGVDPALIKLRCVKGIFPAEIREALVVENNSDSREDYFEADTVRLLPGHPLYDDAAAFSI